MGIVIVEICDGNAITSLDIESIIEEEFPEVAVLKNHCLSLCGLCSIRPFALVNNRRIIGETADDCLTKIRSAIEEELAIYE